MTAAGANWHRPAARERRPALTNRTIHLGPRPTRADRSAAELIGAALAGAGAAGAVATGDRPDGDAVVVGTTASNPWIADLARRGAVDVSPVRPSTPEEGFHLRLLAEDGRRLLAVAGSGPLGVLYGADELAARISETGTSALAALEGLDERDGPHFALRAFKMVPPLRDDYVARRRLNAVYLPTWMPVGTDFAGVHAGLQVMAELAGVTPDDWKDLQWWEQRSYRGRFPHLRQPPAEVQRQVDAYRRRLAELRELGVQVFLSRYEWGFPILTLARAHFAGEVVTGDIDAGKDISLCLSSERMQQIVRLTYERTFELFPELSGVVVYTSAEGGFGSPCGCERCADAFRRYEAELPPGFRIGGPRAERGSSAVRFFHTWAFDLVHDAVKAVRPDAEVVRNVWDFQPIKSPLAAEYVDRQTPPDVIFMPYTVSTDTNLREDPNPQITLWTGRGRRVVPKMCQLVELHPRSGCFPNDMVDRVARFYRDWGRAGVHGVVLHGGWLPGERFGDYAAMEDNIGFGINLDLHWKLLWNPFRDDVDLLKERWLERTFGAGARDVAGRCLQRAGRIYRLGPPVHVAGDPTYRDYQGYAAKADGVGGDAGFLYPFGFDMLLLNDKLTHKFLANPAFMHREFVYNYQEYPRFRRDLADALAWIDRNVAELEELLVAGVADLDRERIAALAEWFRVERRFLRGLELLYRGEELYLIRGAWAEAAAAYGRAHAVLREALVRWGRIAIEQAVWPFSTGGHFYPYRGAPPDAEGAWLEGDVFGVFLRWLAARSADPRGPDVIGTYESGPRHFLAGLRRFRWPME